MAEERSLPGWPKKSRQGRAAASVAVWIRPTRSDLWRATWAWAEKIGMSYWKMHWPQAWEIGTQYILLLLIQMKENRSLETSVPGFGPHSARGRRPAPNHTAARVPGDCQPDGEEAATTVEKPTS